MRKLLLSLFLGVMLAGLIPARIIDPCHILPRPSTTIPGHLADRCLS